jgi:ABC-type nitrate/sulfonate/bicarbonate transport system permease component
MSMTTRAMAARRQSIEPATIPQSARTAGGTILSIATVILALLAWEITARVRHSVYIPSVTQIAVTFVHEWFSPTFREEAVPSLYRMFAGYTIAAVCGISLGVIIGYFRFMFRLLDPVLQYLRATPPTAIIPVGILLIGIGDWMKILVIAFGAFWAILINTADGARLVPRERLETAKVFGLNSFETLVRVVVPSATPQIAAGMRTGLAIAFILIVVSEMIGSTNGLGYYILQAQRTFAIPEMYGGVVLLAILGFTLNTVFVFVESRVLGWHYGQSSRAK